LQPALSRADFDQDSPPDRIAVVAQTLLELAQERLGVAGHQSPDPRHARLLPARAEWPRGRGTAEKRDEFAPPHVSP
jgi:hypothetical protein